MKYLKEAIVADNTFLATFTSGATTKSHDAACFFMTMQERCVGLDEVDAYVKMGKMVEPSHNWAEIERIAATFRQERAA